MGLLDDAIREHLELKRKHGASDEEISHAEQEALAPARRDVSPGAGLPPLESVPGEAVEPPPPPPPGEETQAPPPPDAAFAPEPEPPVPPEEPALEAPPADEPVYADEYAAEPAPADFDEPVGQPPLAYDDEEDYLAPEPAQGGPAPHPPLESVEPIDPDQPEEAPAPGTPKPHGDPALADDDLEPDEVPADERLDEPPADPYRARTSILDEPLRDEPAPPASEEPPADDQDVLEETPEFLQETPEHDKLWFEQKPPRDFDFE
jgi:hypothetical protein